MSSVRALQEKLLRGTADNFPTPELLRQANSRYYSRPENRNQSVSIDGDGLPVPVPARQSKQEVFKQEDYATLDRKALEAPEQLLDGTLNELVDYLIDGTRTELEKVRVIFRWITAQNPSKHCLSDVTVFSPITPGQYLVAIDQDNKTYHQLMAELCSCAGIQVKKVDGIVKGVDYEPGDKIPLTSNSHWTAVLIDSCWHLVDLLWSCQYVTKKDENWVLIDDNGEEKRNPESEATGRHLRFNDAYFLMSPEEFIYSHLPESQEWQLLARPVTRDEWEEMAYLQPKFFRYGLQMDRHKTCIVPVERGEAALGFVLPVGAKLKFVFKLWMWKDAQTISPTFNKTALRRYVLLQAVGKNLQCIINFPSPGKFKLVLFCLDISNSDKTYEMVCAHLMMTERPKPGVKPYPENSRFEWGPGYDLAEAGLRPVTHMNGMVVNENGALEMIFSALNDVGFMAKVHSNKMTAGEMDKFICYQIDRKQVTVFTKFPQSGDFSLNIYAKRKVHDSDDNTLTNVCSYLISVLKPAAIPTAFAAYGRLGATDAMWALGVQPKSHPSALIKLTEAGFADFVFSSPKGVKFLADLELFDDDNFNKKNEFKLVEKSLTGCTFHTRFPKEGQYKLTIYGKDSKVAGSYPQLFTYLVVVDQPSTPCFPFPDVFDKWTDDCRMLKPDFGGALFAGQKVPVEVHVPAAHGVAFINGSSWTHLVRSAEVAGKWMGELITGSEGDSIKLAASFTAASSSFDTLMVYKTLNPELMKAAAAAAAAVRSRPKLVAQAPIATANSLRYQTSIRDGERPHNYAGVEQIKDGATKNLVDMFETS